MCNFWEGFWRVRVKVVPEEQDLEKRDENRVGSPQCHGCGVTEVLPATLLRCFLNPTCPFWLGVVLPSLPW